MIDPKDFTEVLIRNKLGPLIEVPCSYFKDFLIYARVSKACEIINPTNEASAVGIASGKYLATGTIPIVAIQNSGLMNTLNALTSLNQIYDIPIFYIVSWRGEGGKGYDAPEHDIIGTNMKEILKTFKIPYQIVNDDKYPQQIRLLSETARETKKPVALIIRQNTFSSFELSVKKAEIYEMSRFDAMKIIKKKLLKKALFLSTTGYTTRDSFAIKDTPDFYMVGSMGHIFSLGLGLAPHTNKRVVIFDGDGSCLMQLGGLASFNPAIHKNILYIVFDNESYESTGGQPSVSGNIDFSYLAKAFKFQNFYQVTTSKELVSFLSQLPNYKGAVFAHIKVRHDVKAAKRVSDTYSCPQIKKRFMANFKIHTT